MRQLILISCCSFFLFLGGQDKVFAQTPSKEDYEKIAQADKLFSWGLPHLNNGQYDSAHYYFKESLSLYHKAKNRDGVLSSGIYLAIALKNQGQISSLLTHEKELESYMNESDSLFTHIKLSLGAAHYAEGNYLAALRYLKRSQDSFEDQASDNYALLLHIHSNQAQIYRKIRCPKPAIPLYEKILALEEEEKIVLPSYEKLRLLIHASEAHAQTYQQEKAITYINLADRLFNQEKTEIDLAQKKEIQEKMGSAYESMGDYSQAARYFSRQIASLPKTDSTYPGILFRLAKLSFLNKHYSQALDSLQFSSQDLIGNRKLYEDEIVEAYFMMGEVQRLEAKKSRTDSSAYQAALEFYQQAFTFLVDEYEGNSVHKLPELTTLPQKEITHQLLWSYAQTLRQQLAFEGQDPVIQIQRCLAAYQKAMDLGDLLRKNIQFEEPALIPLDSLNSYYEGAIEVANYLYKKSKDDRYLGIGFQFSQRKRASESRELFWEYFRRNGYPWTLEEQINRRAHIVRLAEAEAKQATDKPKEENKLIRKLASKRKDSYESFINSLSYSHSAYFSLKNKRDYTDIDELREYLGEREVLLSFFMGKKALYIFSLRKRSIEVQELALEKLLSTIHKFLGQVYSPDSKVVDYAQVANKLYQQLVEPSLQDTTTSLILIPDNILNYLAFEALTTSPSQGSDFSQLNYLVQKFPIRYLGHSADLLPENRSSRNHSDQDRYAVFLPTYTSLSTAQWLDSLKLSSAQLQHTSDYGFSSVDAQRETTEKRIALMKGDAFLGRKSTKRNFERYASKYTSLDIMGIALSTDYQPVNSGLSFSNHREKESHFLPVHKILQKRLSNDLMVLPNHSTVGEHLQGRGIKAIVGAFHLARCRNLALSLWQIQGNSNQQILGDFYRNLYTGMGKARSLQEAKRAYLTDSQMNSHPYYWASLALYGDNIELEGEERPWWSYGALIFALAMIFLIIFGFRRKRK